MKRALFTAFCAILLINLYAKAEAPWRFIIVGDSRSNNISECNGINCQILSEIAAEIVGKNAEFVVFPGDLVSGYVDQTQLQMELTSWRNIMQPVYNAGIGVYPVRGNHDMGSPSGQTAWNNVFSGAYALPQDGPAGEINATYSVQHKNVLVLALDEYITNMRVNQTWVNSKLAANTKPYVVAMGHVPAFAVNHADCLDDYVAQRDAFWESLENCNANQVIYACGHDHLYDHAVVSDGDGNNVPQYIVGTGGAPINSWNPPYSGSNSIYTPEQWHHAEQYGYIVVDVTDDGMRFTWYQRDSLTGQYFPAARSPDVNGDGIINWQDFEIMKDWWLSVDCRIANQFCQNSDQDEDMTVNFLDYALVADKWLESKPLDFQVAAGSDDAEENNTNGSVNLTSTDLELITDSAAQTVGIRYQNVGIPNGAQIANAYLQFIVDETGNTNPCNLNIYVQDSDNALTFTTAAYNISSRPRTAAVAWSPPNWTVVGQAGIDQRTPNLASIIEAVAARPGWTSGNSMVFIINGTGKRVAGAKDTSNTAPILHIELE